MNENSRTSSLNDADEAALDMRLCFSVAAVCSVIALASLLRLLPQSIDATGFAIVAALYATIGAVNGLTSSMPLGTDMDSSSRQSGAELNSRAAQAPHLSAIRCRTTYATRNSFLTNGESRCK